MWTDMKKDYRWLHIVCILDSAKQKLAGNLTHSSLTKQLRRREEAILLRLKWREGQEKSSITPKIISFQLFLRATCPKPAAINPMLPILLVLWTLQTEGQQIEHLLKDSCLPPTGIAQAPEASAPLPPQCQRYQMNTTYRVVAELPGYHPPSQYKCPVEHAPSLRACQAAEFPLLVSSRSSSHKL